MKLGPIFVEPVTWGIWHKGVPLPTGPIATASVEGQEAEERARAYLRQFPDLAEEYAE